MEDTVKIIAYIRNDFSEKFGIPRQSGLHDGLSVIEFVDEYRNDAALRGIEDFSHLWLIWKFSRSERDNWSPTVRPPRLGGNKRMGVFATRSPFRPNPLGLSSVRLCGTQSTENGTVLIVKGADLSDGTPIYDIKPYLAFTDSHPDAVCGFSDEKKDYALNVEISSELLVDFPTEKQKILADILSQDPRPAYIDDSERIFGFCFGGFEIRFRVDGATLFVTEIRKRDAE